MEDELINPKKQLTRKDIIMPDLSYRVVGILFDVYNSMGSGHMERVYQNAISQALKENGVKFIGQPNITLKYKDAKVGRYIPDFLIEDSLVLELKQGVKLNRTIYDQANAYLKASDYSLAIIACFNRDGLLFRRVVNTYKQDS